MAPHGQGPAGDPARSVRSRSQSDRSAKQLPERDGECRCKAAAQSAIRGMKIAKPTVRRSIHFLPRRVRMARWRFSLAKGGLDVAGGPTNRVL